MIPPRSGRRGVDGVRGWAVHLAPVLVVLSGVSVGCSQRARDRLMHWFFEIPAPSQGTAAPPSEPSPSADIPETQATFTSAPRFASVHPPFALRQCDQCHSAAERMRVRADALDTCRGCHERYFSDAVGHAPVAQGLCADCHDMHRSRDLALLRKSVFETCVECHEEPESLSPDAHRDSEVRRCTKCHDAHFGAAKLLKAGVSTAAKK